MENKKILFFELPTFPKGTLSLSLYAVAAAFDRRFAMEIVDLNFEEVDYERIVSKVDRAALYGLKVSSQNFPIAIALSKHLKSKFPSTPVLWGGELPSLLPDEALNYCDAVVSGPFEPVAEELAKDLYAGELKSRYAGDSKQYEIQQNSPPRFDLMTQPERYYSFMGLPMETSRGCTQRCVFCLVHVMQKKYNLKTTRQLENELAQYEGQFINLVDYNLGVDRAHVIQVSKLIQASGALGWMGEMCLENLDDDEMLQAMQASGCRMIYCGLESIDESSLLSINKSKTNQIANYERIIRKVQSYGIQIAAGLILGLAGTTEKTFEKTYDFFQRMGIIYTKLTFLTYNPGTKVQQSMRKMGTYLTEDIKKFDGNHLSFMANGVDKEVVYKGATYFIKKFYALPNIIQRSFRTQENFLGKLEFILFSYCYAEVYKSWLAYRIFEEEQNFQTLLLKPLKKRTKFVLAEKLLNSVRKWRCPNGLAKEKQTDLAFQWPNEVVQNSKL